MPRLAILFVLVLFALTTSGCNKSEQLVTEAQIELHFEANEAAFNKLAEVLATDEKVQEVVWCPPTGICDNRFREPTAEELISEKNYQPLLADLNSEGWFLLKRLSGDAFAISTLGTARERDYEVEYYFVAFPERLASAGPCAQRTTIGDHDTCYRPLNDDWSVLETRVSIAWQLEERAAFDKCIESGRSDCWETVFED